MVLAEYERLKALATAKFKEKKFAEAIKYYDEAAKVVYSPTNNTTPTPTNATITTANTGGDKDLTCIGYYVVCKSNAAQCCMNIGDFKGAIKYAYEALSEDPTNVKALYRRGISLLEVTLIIIVMLSLGGFLTYEMPIYYQWIMDSNVFHFTISALVSNEFNGLHFDVNGVKVPAIELLPPLMKPKRSIAANVGILICVLSLLRLAILLLLILEQKPNKMQYILSKLPFNFTSPSPSYSKVALKDGVRTTESSIELKNATSSSSSNSNNSNIDSTYGYNSSNTYIVTTA